VLATLCAVVIQYARVWRFGYLVRPFAQPDFSALFRIGNIGMFAIFALPIRLGELVRPFMLKRDYGAKMSAGIGSVAAERVIDGLVVTLGFFVLTRSGVVLPLAMAHAGLAALLVFVGAAVVLGIVLVGHEQGAALLRRLVSLASPRLAERLVGMLIAFADGLRALTQLRPLGAYLFFTFVFWFLNGLANYLLFFALGIPLALPVAFVLTALTVIALMLPAGPGMIGTVQAAIVWGLTALGVDPSLAFAYSVLTYLSGSLVTVGFGLWSLVTSHLSMTSLVEESQHEAA
jgi:uncharacterized protein (TIRG00374 family)